MEWIGDNGWAAWLALALIFGALELASLDLVLGMLAVGSLAGMVAALVGVGVPAQVIVALATSAAMLLLVRPTVTRQLRSGPDLVQGHQALVGESGYVVAEISDQSGQIKIRGEIWTARPYDSHAVIAAGARVEVFEIRGATAYVHELPQLGA